MWLERKEVDEKRVLDLEYWPPHSPDLNPLDYCVCTNMHAVARKNQNVPDISKLEKLMVKEWRSIPQSVFDDAILGFRKRLRIIIEAKGSDIEHLL